MLRRSIRRRTLALVIGTLMVALALISYRSYRDAAHEIEELFDARLAQSARLLVGLVDHRMPADTRQALQAALDEAAGYRREASGPRALAGHHYEGKLVFTVFDEAGAPWLQSAGAPEGALARLLARRGQPADVERPFAHLEPGFYDLVLDDHHWRLFLVEDRRDALWMLVGERGDVRGELVGKIAQRSLLPDLVGLPLLALLVWLAIGLGLRPLARMAQLLKSRDADNLAPLLLEPLPAELEPVGAALNRLLDQVNRLLEREKRFIADAAHELRTPLAVLRIHAQNARQAPDPADRAQALEQLLNGVDRATRVVAQMLTLARLEPGAAHPAMQRLDLRGLARDVLAELAPLALPRDQELALIAEDGADLSLTGEAASLATLVQNLVGNALQYGKPGGRVQVALEAVEGGVRLRVDDDGPGVPAALRPALGQRFFRQAGGEGAGLGLSIVARIAELHGARLAYGDSPLGGLRAEVWLPRRPVSFA